MMSLNALAPFFMTFPSVSFQSSNNNNSRISVVVILVASDRALTKGPTFSVVIFNF